MSSRLSPGRRSEPSVIGCQSCNGCPGFRFIVRDFTYDPNAIKEQKREKSKLELQLKKQFVSRILVNFLSVGAMYALFLTDKGCGSTK